MSMKHYVWQMIRWLQNIGINCHYWYVRIRSLRKREREREKPKENKTLPTVVWHAHHLELNISTLNNQMPLAIANNLYVSLACSFDRPKYVCIDIINSDFHFVFERRRMSKNHKSSRFFSPPPPPPLCVTSTSLSFLARFQSTCARLWCIPSPSLNGRFFFSFFDDLKNDEERKTFALSIDWKFSNE